MTRSSNLIVTMSGQVRQVDQGNISMTGWSNFIGGRLGSVK